MITLGIAAFPLESAYDTAHGLFAALGYLTLAAIPVAAAPELGRPGWARLSMATGLVSAVCLLASILANRDGLFQ